MKCRANLKTLLEVVSKSEFTLYLVNGICIGIFLCYLLIRLKLLISSSGDVFPDRSVFCPQVEILSLTLRVSVTAIK